MKGIDLQQLIRKSKPLGGPPCKWLSWAKKPRMSIALELDMP
jgi:hypothetical protein